MKEIGKGSDGYFCFGCHLYCYLSSECLKMVLASQEQGKRQLINLRPRNSCLITGPREGKVILISTNVSSDILHCHWSVLRNSSPSHVLSFSFSPPCVNRKGYTTTAGMRGRTWRVSPFHIAHSGQVTLHTFLFFLLPPPAKVRIFRQVGK